MCALYYKIIIFLIVLTGVYSHDYKLNDVHISLSNKNGEILLTFSNSNEFNNCLITYNNVNYNDYKNTSVIMKPYPPYTNVYAAVLSDLLPNQMYYYEIIIDQIMVYKNSFRSPPNLNVNDESSVYRVILFGDQGTTISPNECASHQDCGAKFNNDFIANSIGTSSQPNFVAVVGDLAYDRGNESIWQVYMNQVSSWASSIPMVACVGNEDHALNFSQYRHRLFLPSQDITAALAPWYFSFDYDYLHVVSMSTEYSHNGGASFYPGSEQYAWLVNDLQQAAKTARWIIVLGHRPLYCSSNDYYDCNIWDKESRPVLEPLYKKYGVSAVFSGHVHSYERTFPVYNGTKISSSYDNPQAPVYLMVGAGGAGLTHKWANQPKWSGKRIIDYGLGYLTVKWNSLEFDFISTDNTTTKILDSIVITKT